VKLSSPADFYLLKPVDLAKANQRILYEVGNRGGKAMLGTFSKGHGGRRTPTTGCGVWRWAF